jgi:hypothetical protein
MYKKKGVVTHFSSWLSRTDDQKERKRNMFAVDKENERDSYEWSKWEREKKDISKCSDCHCIRILRLSADVYTSQKRLVEQSFSTRFISFTYILSLSFSYIARAYTIDERRRKFWIFDATIVEREKRTKRTNNHLTSFCLYSSYSRQSIVI